MKVDKLDLSLFEAYLKKDTNILPSIRKGRDLRDGTVFMYVNAIKSFLESNPNLDSLDSYNNFLGKHVIKSQSKYYYYALKHFIQYKISDSTTRNQLLSGIQTPKVVQGRFDRKNLDENEIDKVINNLQIPKHKIMASIQKETGLRSCDIFWLRATDIKVEKGITSNKLRLDICGKGGKASVVYIFNTELIDKIIAYRDEALIVKTLKLNIPEQTDGFATETGKQLIFMEVLQRRKKTRNEFELLRINYRRYLNDLKTALNTCGFQMKDWATHDFRRNFAKRFFEKNNRDIYKLKRAMRHSSIDITERYLAQTGLDMDESLRDMQRVRFKLLEDDAIQGFKKGHIFHTADFEADDIEKLDGLVRDGTGTFMG